MWATSPHLMIAGEVMKRRGFTYKTTVIWHKMRPGEGRGTGYWFINEHEQMLIGVRGKVPAPAPGTQWPSVIEALVGKHSEKPEIFLEILEQYFPTLPKIELNRRGPARPGWDAWGNEVPAQAAE
jgi:N6-adenosine-specific RNA methylase IME4